MNNIELKAIKDLIGMSFYIPNYQRGYRWGVQQIKDLLKDIKEFNEEEAGFYCIQPLVVSKREYDILKRIKEEAQDLATVEHLLKGSWEVIDGQQRLTTIYIILKCLDAPDYYSIEYDTKNIDLNNPNDDNIDSYHINLAYNTVRAWLDEENIDRSSYKDKLLNSVKFIWYESIGENVIDVFTRLNIGKISLTNSELIKALMLNSSNFENVNNINSPKPQEISSEWDNIEYTLQDDAFWLFMHRKEYHQPTRIDYIFDIICKHNALQLSSKQSSNTEDHYKTFRYFYEYFQTANGNIKECWSKVKRYYQILNEWYHDLTLFHYVGFLAAAQDNSDATISSLIKKWDECSNKTQFMAHLKEVIKEIIEKCPKLDSQYSEDGSNKTKCKNILLFHNIQTAINQNVQLISKERYQMGIFYKFPFHLYKLENWDVEHINSNTSNLLDDDNSRCEWLSNIYLSAETEDQDLILSYFESDKEIGEKNEIFKQLMERYKDKEEWSQQEKNKIWNYTLLDSSTNRSYGNMIFSGKRRVIIGKDCGKNISIPLLKKKDNRNKMEWSEETSAESSFVPLCTRRVFLKYYSASYSDNNYWTKDDARQYLNDIQDCIDKLN